MVNCVECVACASVYAYAMSMIYMGNRLSRHENICCYYDSILKYYVHWIITLLPTERIRHAVSCSYCEITEVHTDSQSYVGTDAENSDLYKKWISL